MLYLQELKEIAELEDQALKAFQSVTGDRYQGDAPLQKALTETVIPKYTDFERGLWEIRPATNEVSGLSRLYRRRAYFFLSGAKQFSEAIREGNKQAAEAAVEQLSDSGLYLQQWEKKIQELKGRLETQ